MKIVETAKLIDMARIISFVTMLAYAVMLCIRFISNGLSVGVYRVFTYLKTQFNCNYTRKSVVHRKIHERKHAVFSGNPDSGAGLSG